MKKLIASILSFLVVFSPFALAQTEEVDPGMTPDNILYGLERAEEETTMLIKGLSGPSAQAKYGLKLAKERVAEAKVLKEKGLENKAEQTRDGAQKRLEEAEKKRTQAVERVRQRNENIPEDLEKKMPDIKELNDDVGIPEKAKKIQKGKP